MSRGGDASQWTAQQTLSYINGLIAAEDNDKEDREESLNSTLYTALSISYEYLTNATKRKITWSLSLEKLAYQFIELAFQTNMHSAIKDIFKSYRAITQGQYSESLKYVLEHYRDKKLETILEQEITASDLPLIRDLPNIEIDEPSPEIILDSLHPQLKQRQTQVRNKLKLVWEGYKSIVETVRVNQKLEDVYMATLNKIFDFVDRYNRVQQFKSFCKSLRTGLQTAFNKRDKAEQQKAIYIDIEKTDVNTRNIEIRMEQFKVATKLGLWGESFQVLEDVSSIMKVRKAPLKNSLKCQYFQSLALLFSKNNFWHYHAFAYFNYYIAYLTKPKITQQEKQRLSDKLLLSILAIPQVTLERSQSKDIQEKVSSMITPSGKIPTREQLVELMISRGVLESSSKTVNQLWNFMFLEFGVTSLNKGLQLVKNLDENNKQFQSLIEATLINKQLLSIAEVYQRIRLSSLERLINLPLQNIKRILIEAHRQKTLDFTFDESQGILVFEDQTQQINPTEEFHSIFIDVSILIEQHRKLDETHIRKKAEEYIKNADQNIWSIRQYKIDEFKKKLKKPQQDLRNARQQREKENKEKKQLEQIERKLKEAEAIKKGEELQKQLAAKKIIINDIISIKEQRVVRIMEKKIQHLTDQEIDNLTVETLQEHLQATKKKISNNKEARLKKAFTHVDYIERERRLRLTPKIQNSILNAEQQAQRQQIWTEAAKRDYDQHHSNQEKLQILAKYYKGKIQTEVKQVHNQFQKDLGDFKKIIKDNFKDKILAKAKALFQENQKKKEQQAKLQEELLKQIQIEDAKNGKWSFKGKATNTTTTSAPVLKKDSEPAPQISIGKSNNVFEKLEGIKEEKEGKPERKQETGGKWAIGSKKIETPVTPPVEKKQQPKQVEKPPQAPSKPQQAGGKWAIGSKKVQEKPQTATIVIPPPVEKKEEPKKAVFTPPPPTNPAPEKKGKWIDVNQPVKKEEEKKPQQQQQAPIKKGKGF